MLPYSLRQAHFFRDVFATESAQAIESFADRPVREIRQTFQACWASSQLDSCLVLGDWLHRQGELTRSEAYFFARALTVMGREAEALSILLDERYSNEKAWQYWLAVATALAAASRLPEAADALARAEAMGGRDNPRTVLLAQALGRVRQTVSSAEDIAQFADAAELVRAWLVLGLPARSVEAYGAALERFQPRSDKQIIEALVLAQEIARFADAALAVDLEALVRAYFQPLGLLRGDRGLESSTAETSPGEIAAPVGEPAAQLFVALAQTRQGRHQAAAVRLGPVASRFTDESLPGASTARLDLAASVGRMVIDEVKPRLRSGGPRKIVDMFLFADEFSLLRIKLEEMYDWVDRFVIVEAPVTFRGDPKPLHFAERKAEFARFADKILHVVVDTIPEGLENAWGRQFYQRDCGLRAVAEICAEDDIVLVSDADEVIDRQVVESFTGPFASLGLRYYSYFFNLELIEDRQWRWTAMTRARYLTRMGAGYSRIAIPCYAKGHFIENAGWHFSKVRSPEELARKFGRNSNIVRSAVDRDTLSRTIAQIRADGGLEGYVRRDLDKDFPRYLQRHAADLRELIL